MARLNASLHPKLTDSAISILFGKKIYTVFDLVSEDSEKIMQYSGLTYQEILDLKQSIIKLYNGGIKTGNELLKDSCDNLIKTGIRSLDNLMNGGLDGGEIYEICGLSSSGKSQLCHTVATNVVHDSLQDQRVVHYVDTKRDFSAKRILTILKDKKLNEETQGLILHNILVTRIETVGELMNFLHSLKEKSDLQDDKKKLIKLIVIDSLPAIFFKFDRDTTWETNFSALNHLANILRCVANVLNVPLITVNLITQWKERAFQITGSKSPTNSKPGLGKYWETIPNTRILVETLEFERRKITVWKSSRLSIGSSCEVVISNAGVC